MRQKKNIKPKVKRIVECRLCGKKNDYSYVCKECRAHFEKQREKRLNAKQGHFKEFSRKCTYCGCSLNTLQSNAYRCRDCKFALDGRRRSVRKRLDVNESTIALLESGKGCAIGREQRIINLKLHREKLLLRLQSTYTYTKE